jgi:hypothetical protein
MDSLEDNSWDLEYKLLYKEVLAASKAVHDVNRLVNRVIHNGKTQKGHLVGRLGTE